VFTNHYNKFSAKQKNLIVFSKNFLTNEMLKIVKQLILNKIFI